MKSPLVAPPAQHITSDWLNRRSDQVRKGEHGSLVVYADKIIRSETDTATGEESERAIPFLKGYTVFNVEQIDGLPEHFYGKPAPRTETIARIRGTANSHQLNGWLNRIWYMPTRQSDAALKDYTR